MTSQPIRVAFEERRALTPDDIAALGVNMLVDMRFERPADLHHGVVVLADAADLTRLFELPASTPEEVIAAEPLLSLGDIVSTFLDSLVGELTWLRPTPRAWLANLEPLPATGAELPELVAADDPLYVASVTLTGAEAGPFSFRRGDKKGADDVGYPHVRMCARTGGVRWTSHVVRS